MRNKNKQRAKNPKMTIRSEGSKDKPMHHCNICHRGFLNKSNIKVHLRTHTGEKPFKCETCSKAFRQKAHLLKHYQIHRRAEQDKSTPENEMYQQDHDKEFRQAENNSKRQKIQENLENHNDQQMEYQQAEQKYQQVQQNQAYLPNPEHELNQQKQQYQFDRLHENYQHNPHSNQNPHYQPKEENQQNNQLQYRQWPHQALHDPYASRRVFSHSNDSPIGSSILPVLSQVSKLPGHVSGDSRHSYSH